MTERSQSGTFVNFQERRRIVHTRTEHSEILLTETTEHGRVLFMDNEVQFAESDEHRYHELLVHPGLSVVPNVYNVLILGGGDGLAAREVAKWKSVKHIDIVDYDDVFVEKVVKPHLSDLNGSIFSNPIVRYIPANALTYARNIENHTYDFIIIDLPDPEGEFVQLYHDLLYACERILAPRGGIALHIGPVALHDRHPFWNFFSSLMDTASHVYGRTHRGHMRSAHIPSFMNPWGFFYVVPRNSSNTPLCYSVCDSCRFWNPFCVQHKLLSTRPFYVGDKDIQKITDALCDVYDDYHP